MKDWKYPVGSIVVVNNKAKDGAKYDIGKLGVVEDLLSTDLYDYRVRLEGALPCKFKEEELDYFLDVGDTVEIRLSGEKAEVIEYDFKHKQVELRHDDDSEKVYLFTQLKEYDLVDRVLDNLEKKDEQETQGKFEKIGHEIGKFTDEKNLQYGSSVDATYEMMKVLMERYRHDNGHYLIPEELLPHILLQVRMMDKQNRIFNNPSGKGDSESPYNDLTGYSIIGVDMVERRKQNAN